MYTQVQAQRGEASFRQSCASCHTLADFTGDVFLRRWPTVGTLFDVVSTTMPQDLPGGLSQQQYADILSYLLSRNGYPSGSAELPATAPALNAIVVQPPPR